ncbi:Uncharacterised protein [Salmonella enterica subsp. enterica serovar Bovismorbificans]|uniref:Uncharacterized protein n=1 Tax=Salmonella enterica subsp. enterica serovar Bovismorbificans TaxID=58097 RepID=A0A655BXN4_SALET|nr:Uncharacterised protein [Salmonella enterica subsp. enterica serovar Bovismorbificans]
MGTLSEDKTVDIPGEHRLQALLLHFGLIAVVRQHGLITMRVGDGLNAA